ncbi:1-phosphofructokinase family hexose kinase [Aestuariivirga sp.]|uniref:1-phosphofructokinase family hexose kinase n=1 Tax=Aestuariivirga sp. TaxID=2650926 RepID=UPI0035930B0D
MAPILTITLNPTIDVFGEALEVQPTHKVRMTDARHEPGGGGINVARVISVLGGNVEALFLSGGEMGVYLGRLLDDEGIRHHAIPIDGQTRIAFMVHDQKTGLEYRFLPEGPEVLDRDIAACVDAIGRQAEGFVVVSGSLPRGAPPDSYARMTKAANARGLKLVLDSSGAGLKAAVEAGGIHLLKPSRSELEHLTGRRLTDAELEPATRELASTGKARFIAVTLGAEGALLVSRDITLRLPALDVPVRSAVGAGDSFLGAMVWAISTDWPLENAFRLGMAAGAAATMNSGTVLCRRDDVLALYERSGG